MWGCCGLCWRAFSDRRRLGPGHSIHPGILASCQPGRHLAAVPAHLSPEGHFPNICQLPTAPPCHSHNTHAHVTHHTTHTYLHTTHTRAQHTHAHSTHTCTHTQHTRMQDTRMHTRSTHTCAHTRTQHTHARTHTAHTCTQHTHARTPPELGLAPSLRDSQAGLKQPLAFPWWAGHQGGILEHRPGTGPRCGSGVSTAGLWNRGQTLRWCLTSDWQPLSTSTWKHFS